MAVTRKSYITVMNDKLNLNENGNVRLILLLFDYQKLIKLNFKN
jgi:hypothetical protein